MVLADGPDISAPAPAMYAEVTPMSASIATSSRRNPAVRRRPAGGSQIAQFQGAFHGGYAGKHQRFTVLFLRLKLRLTVYHNGFTGSASTEYKQKLVPGYYCSDTTTVSLTIQRNDEIPSSPGRAGLTLLLAGQLMHEIHRYLYYERRTGFQ